MIADRGMGGNGSAANSRSWGVNGQREKLNGQAAGRKRQGRFRFRWPEAPLERHSLQDSRRSRRTGRRRWRLALRMAQHIRQSAGGAEGIQTGLAINWLRAGYDPGTFVEQLSQCRLASRTSDDLLCGQRDDGQNFFHGQVPGQAAQSCLVHDDPIYLTDPWRARRVDHLVQGQRTGPVTHLYLPSRTTLGNVPGKGSK
jgi:hypothetical protein